MEPYSNTLLSFTGDPAALLCFDHVITGTHPDHACWLIRWSSLADLRRVRERHRELRRQTVVQTKAQKQALPPHLDNEEFLSEFCALLKVFTMVPWLARVELPDFFRSLGHDRQAYEVARAVPFKRRSDVLADWRLRDFLERFGLESAAIEFPPYTCKDDSEGNSVLVVTYSGLSLVRIDPSHVPDEQILEFRKDKRSMDKMRRFRGFAYKNFAGKSKGQIEDELGDSLREYEITAKKWGLKLVRATYTTLMQSKAAATSFVGTTLAALSGYPLAAIPLAIPFVVKVGDVLLEVQERRIDREEAELQNPVSYVKYLEKNLSQEK